MRFIRYIFQLFLINIKKETFFRLSFILKLIGKSSWVITTFVFFKIIFKGSNTIAGWDEGQILILLGTSGIIYSVFSFLCFNGAGSLSGLVRNGTIEIFLLKPIPAPIFLLFRFASIPDIISVIVPLSVFITGVSKSGFLGVINILLWSLSSVISFFIYTSLHFLLGLLAFKFIQINPLFFILSDFADLAKYPYKIFPLFLQRLFLYIIPILLITNYPVLVYFGEYHLIFIQILILLVFIILIKLLFPLARKSYQGAGTYV